MIISNEPGYYKEGAYGIRIEYLVVVTAAEFVAGGDRPMLGFETLTLCRSIGGSGGFHVVGGGASLVRCVSRAGAGGDGAAGGGEGEGVVGGGRQGEWVRWEEGDVLSCTR